MLTYNELHKLSLDLLPNDRHILLCESINIAELNTIPKVQCSALYAAFLCINNELTIDQIYGRFGEDVAATTYDLVDCIKTPSVLLECSPLVQVLACSYFLVSICKNKLSILDEPTLLELQRNKHTHDLGYAIKDAQCANQSV